MDTQTEQRAAGRVIGWVWIVLGALGLAGLAAMSAIVPPLARSYLDSDRQLPWTLVAVVFVARRCIHAAALIVPGCLAGILVGIWALRGERWARIALQVLSAIALAWVAWVAIGLVPWMRENGSPRWGRAMAVPMGVVFLLLFGGPLLVGLVSTLGWGGERGAPRA